MESRMLGNGHVRFGGPTVPALSVDRVRPLNPWDHRSGTAGGVGSVVWLRLCCRRRTARTPGRAKLVAAATPMPMTATVTDALRASRACALLQSLSRIAEKTVIDAATPMAAPSC